MTDAIPPQILWAQRTDKVLVSIQLEDVTDEKITVDTEKLTFSGKSKNKNYAVELEFNGNIIPEESKQRKGGREYYFDLKKKDSGYWPRLLKDKQKRQYLKIDFNRWKDEDESDDEEEGGPPGGAMGGMGGMGGMYGDANLEDMMKQMGTGGPGGFNPEDADIESDDSDDEDIPELENDIQTEKKE